MVRIIIGIIMIVLGFSVVWKTDFFFNLIGPIPFAEKVFFGGSRSFYKLAGLLIVILGALVVANLQGGLIEGTIGRLYR